MTTFLLSGSKARRVLVCVLSALCLLAVGAQAETWETYTNTSFISGLDSWGDNLWAATNGGALQWDLTTDLYTKYTVSEGLADQWVKEVMVDSDGNVWFGTVEGVQKFNGVNWTTYNTSNSPLPNNKVYSMVQDLDGAIWFGTAYGCAKFDGVHWYVHTNLGGGATNVAVRGIDVDSQNRIWTANNPDDWEDPGGVSMYDGVSWTRLDPDPGNIGQYFLSLTVDNDDNVWAGSWTNWVFMYNGSTWTHYDSGNSGLVGKNIEAFTVEDDGTVWIANHESYATPTTGGVAKYDGSTWTTYTPANSGLADMYVYAITPVGDTIYFGGGYHGISAFDGIAWSYYETINEPATDWYTSLTRGDAGDGELLYCGTHHYGLTMFDGSTWSNWNSLNSDMGADYINDVHLDASLLWVCSQYTGVWRYDGSGWLNYTAANSDLLGDIILSADTDSQGNVWFGTAGWDGPYGQSGAVAKYNGDIWVNYTLESSGLIDDDNLQVAVADNDIIWIGTAEGLNRFDGAYSWTDYTSANSGLLENHVQTIAFDPAGNIWLGTRGGISCFDGVSTWTDYTVADGLPANNIQDIQVSPDGVIWVATNNGVAYYTAEKGWTTYTQVDGLGDDDIRAILVESEQSIWFGSYKSGISHLLTSLTGVGPDGDLFPANRVRVSAWPNPFNPCTTIAFELRAAGHASLTIHDVRGRQVATLVDSDLAAGPHELSWNGVDSQDRLLSSGVYYAVLTIGVESGGTKLILLK